MNRFLKSFLARKRSGAFLMIAMLTIGIVSLIIGLSVGLRGINESALGLAEADLQKMITNAESCVQDTLWRYKFEPNFSGGAHDFGESGIDGTCTVSMAPPDGDTREFTVVSMLGSRAVKMIVKILLTPVGSPIVIYYEVSVQKWWLGPG